MPVFVERSSRFKRMDAGSEMLERSVRDNAVISEVQWGEIQKGYEEGKGLLRELTVVGWV